MAIILISSDLPEVLAMSDRVLVMREGRQVGDALARGGDRGSASSARPWGPHEHGHIRPERLRELSLLARDRRRSADLQPADRRLPARAASSTASRRASRSPRSSPPARRSSSSRGTSTSRSARSSASRRTSRASSSRPTPSTAPVLAVGLAIGDRRRRSGSSTACSSPTRGVPSIIVTLGTLAIYRTWLIDHAESQTITSDSLPDWLIELPNSTALQHRRVRHPHGGRSSPRSLILVPAADRSAA